MDGFPKEGLFWTFNNPSFYSGWTTCQVFSSIRGREGNSGGCGVSGSRECGLFTMGGSKSRSLKAKRVVEHQIVKNCTYLPVPCAENDTLQSSRNSTHGQICLESQCERSPAAAPWGALDFGNQTQVNKKKHYSCFSIITKCKTIRWTEWRFGIQGLVYE